MAFAVFQALVLRQEWGVGLLARMAVRPSETVAARYARRQNFQGLESARGVFSRPWKISRAFFQGLEQRKGAKEKRKAQRFCAFRFAWRLCVEVFRFRRHRKTMWIRDARCEQAGGGGGGWG
jgi:hypothetical protein